MSRTPALTPGAIALLTLVACGAPQQRADAERGYALQRFETCDALRDYVAEAFTETLLSYRYGSGGYDLASEDSAESDGGGESAPADYSETNVQETGVDEADIVETDGEYVYYLQDDSLFIVDSWPADETHLIAELPLEGYPMAMFLEGEQLAVYSYVYSYSDGEGDKEDTEEAPDRETEDDGSVTSDAAWNRAYRTRLSLVDVSDRAAPVVTREVELEGSYVDARRIGTDLYTVTTAWMDMPSSLWDIAWSSGLGLPETDWDASEDERDLARAVARAILAPLVQDAVDAMATEAFLPLFRDQLPGEDHDPEVLLACTDVYRPDHLSYPTLMTVSHLDLDGGPNDSLSGTGLMSEGWTVYASTEHLFVAQTSWYWWWGWGDATVETHIHQFALDGAASVYEGSGVVDGWLLNQFSMSEYGGYLRVATTDTSGWGWAEGDVATDAEATDAEEGDGDAGEDGEATEATAKDQAAPANNVFVLEHANGQLDQVGELRGLAENEQIYAVRFLGERGFMVTFRQVDPLFTIDLSDPTSPALVGELKVPGYSAYLHPLDDDHLLAIGMDGTEDGAITGLAVSLFDVSDFADPQLAAKYTLESDEWSYSEALYDHHAFTYHRGVLSFPAYTYSYAEDTGEWSMFSGILAIEVDTGVESGTPALTELGRVDHADLVAASECYWYHDDSGAPCDDDYWYAWMRRSVVIEDNLYSVSNYGMKVNELLTPEVELAQVLFRPAG